MGGCSFFDSEAPHSYKLNRKDPSMPYQVKKRRRAAEEYNEFCETYPDECHEKVDEWFHTLAEEAEEDTYVISEDLQSSIKYSTEQFKNANLSKRLGMLIDFATKMRPPRRLRHSSLPIRIFHAEAMIDTIYEVEHDSKRIIITKFLGPPHA